METSLNCEILPAVWMRRSRQFHVDNMLFMEGNVNCRLYAHKDTCVHTSVEQDLELIKFPLKNSMNSTTNTINEFICHHEDCTEFFTSVFKYEIHYSTLHRHVCAECRCSFPNQHLLDLHLVELHDVIFQIRSASNPMG